MPHAAGWRNASPGKSRKYVAWDGEGVTNSDGSHSYVMLVTSHGRKECPCGCGQRGDWIINPLGLSTFECLNFYWKHASKDDKAYNVIYGGSYDFNCWMRDIDRSRAKWMWDSNHDLRIGNYKVNYNKRSLGVMRGSKTSTLWDVVRFWQAPFVKAIEMCIPTFDALEDIKKWKAKRSDFHSENLDDVLHYCLTELRALVKMMGQFDGDLREANIGKLTQLNGAGSIAAKLLTLNHVKKHLAVLPPAVSDAALFAYSGGRIELWRYGHHVGPFYTYDIVSAYPRAMTFLPSLADGEWEQTHDNYPRETDFGVYSVRFATDKAKRGYPFFQRLPNGNILYPRAVTGWYCAPELHAASKSGFSFDVLDGWTLRPANGSASPFAFVPLTFDERARLKRNGRIGAQLQLKLGLNSLYGKLAQTVGGTAAEPPPFHCLVWAADVTSRTRATAFAACFEAPDHIAYISTDGIGTTTKLNLDIGKQLGQWEFTEYSEAILVQAGVYFLRCVEGCDCTDDKRGGMWHPKYRGFDAGSIDPDEILRAWKRHDDFIEVPATRFITLGSALAGNHRFKRWCRWETDTRKLYLYGGDGKRYTPHRSSDKPWKELCDLRPTSWEGVTDSARYQPKWNDDLPLQKIDGVDMDVYLDECVAYDNAHRTHHAARESVLHDYFARSK